MDAWKGAGVGPPKPAQTSALKDSPGQSSEHRPYPKWAARLCSLTKDLAKHVEVAQSTPARY